MDQIQSNQATKDALIRLVEYTKYLYEEEKERTADFRRLVRVYLTILTFTAGLGILKLTGMKRTLILLRSTPVNEFQIVMVVLFCISCLMLFFSFVFLILGVKIRKFERLCSPQEFVNKANSMKNEESLLSAINANYVVAVERNFDVNQRKAKYLTFALTTYIIALILFLIALIISTYFQ